MSSRLFQCHFCSVSKFTRQKLWSHLERFHQHQPDFGVTCDLMDCKKRYRSVPALRTHFHRKHLVREESVINSTAVDDDGENDSDINDDEFQHDEDEAPSLNSICVELKKRCSMFLLQLQEQHKLPQSVRKPVLSSVQSLLTYATTSYSSIISHHLRQADFDFDRHAELSELLCTDIVTDAIGSLSSEYEMLKYCKNSLNMVEPQQIYLDKVNGKDAYQYVSILDVLRLILRQPDILDSILGRQQSDSSSLCDFQDGSIYRSHPVFCSSKQSLSIHLYTDEFEVVNPLGSRKTLHKVLAFYFFIGNLHPRYRAQLRHIYLCILAKNSYISSGQYSMATLLEPLISDLKILAEDGIWIEVDGRRVHFTGALATISADNLSVHKLAGFTCCFSSGHICRFCMIDYKDLESKLCEESLVLRTSDSHDRHLQTMAFDKQLSRTAYGVVDVCPFSCLPYFDVLSSFPCDVMHDFLEGVVPLILRVTLLHMHTQRLMTVTQFNAELKSFQYGKHDKDALPCALRTDHLSGKATFPGKASEKFCLFRVLPFLAGRYISKDNRHWRLYLQCREIGDIILAPVIGRSVLSYLKMCIETLLYDFCELYPDHMTPKMHYLLHYADVIALFGPPRALWCMRFEAKHQHFKRLAGVMNNFRNICLSLAVRHQLHQCWQFSSVDILKQDVRCKGSTSIPFSVVPGCFRELICQYTCLSADALLTVERVTEVEVDNITYAVGDIFVLALLHEESVPLFFKVTLILNLDRWILCGRLLISDYYDSHLHAFHISEGENWISVAGSMIDHHPLDEYVDQDGERYVVLRYSIMRS